MTQADGSIIIDTRVDTSGIKRGAAEVQGQFKLLMGAAKKLAVVLAAAFSVKKIIDFSKECIELGSSLDEVQNVVDVTFGKMSANIEKWSKDAAEQFGLSELSAKQYSSTIGAMLKSMGVGGQDLYDMSTKLAELSGDLASFYNLDTDTAFQKIRSGISGETEPLKQLGINLSEANLEQFRLNQGMTTAYKNMNEQQKALLRYNYLLSVTSDAQGDFARTSSSWANQTRILSLNFQSLKADIGKGLINLLTPVLQVINRIISGLAKMASAFKAFTNLLTGQKNDTSTPAAGVAQDIADAATATDGLTDSTKKAAKATKQANKEANKYTSGLDKIHQYQTQDTSSTTPSAGTGKGAAATPAAAATDFGSLSEGETAIDKVDKKLQALVNTIKTAFAPAAKAMKSLWENALKPFGQRIGAGLEWFYKNVLVPLAKWTISEVLPRFLKTIELGISAINAIIDALQPLWQWFWDNVLEPVAKWTGGVFIKAWDAINKALGAFADWCKEHPKTIETITIVIASFFAAWKIVDLVSKIASFVSTISNMVKVLGGLKGVLGIVTSSFNPWILVIGAAIAAGVLLWRNWDTISAKAKEIWGAISAYLKRTVETIKKNFNSFIEGAKSLFQKGWNAIKTTATTIWNGIGSVLSSVWNGISRTASNVWNGISKTISGALSGIGRIAQTIGGKISSALISGFEKAANFIKKPINGIIGLVNGLISGLVGGINLCIGALNHLKIKIPSWIPGFGGKTFGFNLSKLSAPSIPYLATGAVIPPNAPFAAVLGDQKKGNNIEAPESLIRRIVREEAGNNNRKYEFKAVLGRRVLFDQVIEEARLRQQMSGGNPFELA